LLGFNLGIEAMQLLVVLATMPILLLLTRTPVFTPLRIVGALAAGLVSLVWIAERLPQPPWRAWWIGLLLLLAAHLGLRGTPHAASVDSPQEGAATD
jgi:hypothetical protein